MSKKAWGGRFKENTTPFVEKYNASITFDKKMVNEEIACSIAHARMLGKTKIIKAAESSKIIKGLKEILSEIKKNGDDFSVADEDIHMAIENRLRAKIGDLGGKLHTGRSRNDQVSAVFRLWIRNEIDSELKLITLFQKGLVRQAKLHLDTFSPSYTHLQPAQPIRFAHWFLAWYEMINRDKDRLLDARKRVNVSPLGSAALAGTNFPVDRWQVAKELGFADISANSIDAVSSRDFAVEYLFAGSMLMLNLSRFAEDLIFYNTAEVNVISLPDRYCTGSSIMPQKKNPDVLELIRGKTGRTVGNLISLMVVLKGLPLSYNKDLQEDKEPVFDTASELRNSLTAATDIINGLKVDKKKLKIRSEQWYMNAVDIADNLALNGVPFRTAHELVGKLVRYAIEKGNVSFSSLSKEELNNIDERLAESIKVGFGAKESTDGKKIEGAVNRHIIEARIAKIELELSNGK
ncbi:MAG: argininosuccinate lyase [Nitrospinota bacterium]